jgi:TonB family protein
MDGKTRKAVSLSLSVLIHAVLAIALVKIGVHYALPEGTVSDSAEIEVVGGNDGEQTQVVPAAGATSNSDEQNTVIQKAPEPKRPSISKAQQKMEDSLRKQVSDSDAKFMPVEEPHDVVSDEETDKPQQAEQQTEKPADDSDVATALPKKSSEDGTAQPVMPPQEQADAEKTDSEQPEATAAPLAPVETSASDQPQQAVNQNSGAVAGDQALQQNAALPPGQPQTGAAAPPYGTPGTMLDVRKLLERPGNRKPNYPWTARLRRQEGTVIIRAFIRPDGHVDMPVLEKSSGFQSLDEEAIRAYGGWRYEPGASGWVLKPFKFNLSGK